MGTELGQYLKKFRNDSKLSQGFVAEKLGYTSPQFVSNIERGISRPPKKSLKKYLRIIKADKYDVVDLWLWELEDELRRAIR